MLIKSDNLQLSCCFFRILEVTGAAKATVFGSSSVNFAEEYVKSQIYENNLSTMEHLMREYSANQDSVTRKAEKYTSSAYDQVVYLLIRFTKSYWRNSEYSACLVPFVCQTG